MKVIFRVDASLKMGTGHVMRCLTLAQTLKENGANVKFICRRHEGSLIDKIRSNGFDVHALEVSEEIETDNKLVHSHWLGATQQQDSDECIDVLSSEGVDWLIVDHYALDEDWHCNLKPYYRKLMVIDDLADRKFDCDLMLNQNLDAQPEDYKNKVTGKCKFLLGCDYTLLRTEFSELRERALEKRKTTKKIKNILISVGGSDVHNKTYDILIDNNGIWICTNSGLANFNNGGFKVITTLDVKSDGLTGLYGTTAISKSRDGIYFIGGQGVSLYDPNSLKTISAYDGMPVPNNWTNGISDIELGKDGYLWVTSGWNGIYKLSGEVIIENYNINNSKIPANRTIAISFANDGSMWGAHGNAGVSRFINGEFENMTDKLNIPANTIITDIAFDEQGTLWLATNRGLAKYKNDTLTIFDEKDGLIMPKRNCDINIGLNGEIIYSTYGSGISIYDGETFKNYDESNGLVDNRIWDLTVDSKNNIWTKSLS